MTADQSYVIVGASLAGAKAAEAMRDAGFDGSVVLVGDERDRPYERPPLSKGYLLGKDAREKAFVHEEEWYGDHDVDAAARHDRHRAAPLVARDRAVRRRAHRLRQAAARHRLVAAQAAGAGGRPRRECTTCAGVGDSDALREAFARRRVARRGRRAAGSGWRWPRRPGTTASTSPSSSRSRPRCTQPSGARSATSSPRCTATTASTYAPGSGVKSIEGSDGRVTGVTTVVGRGRGGRHRRRRRRASSPTCGSPRPPGSTSRSASSWTRCCRPPTTRSGPPATWPAPWHPLFEAPGARRALGQRVRPGQGGRRGRWRARASPTRSCPTSSPTSTTSAWSTTGYVDAAGLRRRRAARRRVVGGVAGLLAARRSGAGRHERQHLGRLRRDQGAGPWPGGRRPVTASPTSTYP